MLKNALQLGLALLILCGLFFAVLWNPLNVSISVAQPQPKAQIETTSKEHAAKEGCPTLGVMTTAAIGRIWAAIGRIWTAIFPDVHTIFEGVIAMFTVVLGSGTLWLVWTTRVTARCELRAHVFATEARLRHHWRDRRWQQRFGAEIFVKNTGRTPAYDIRIFGGMCIRRYNIDGDAKDSPRDLLTLHYPSTGIAQGIFGPDCGRSKSEWLQDESISPRQARPLRNDEFEGLTDSTMAVFVYGEIQYRDEFGTQRWTTYCFISNQRVWNFRKSEMTTFQKWNEAGIQDKTPKPPFCEASKWISG
ncbi:MAG: hypothetical protein ACHQRJ_15495 [Alphaproteobacteria bacterium]